MAIITCPECKKAVSDSAISCPNCGYPLTKNVSQSQMAVQSEEQEGSIKDIINYLKYAAMLEQTVYTYERTSDRLFDKICSLGSELHLLVAFLANHKGETKLIFQGSEPVADSRLGKI